MTVNVSQEFVLCVYLYLYLYACMYLFVILLVPNYNLVSDGHDRDCVTSAPAQESYYWRDIVPGGQFSSSILPRRNKPKIILHNGLMMGASGVDLQIRKLSTRLSCKQQN